MSDFDYCPACDLPADSFQNCGSPKCAVRDYGPGDAIARRTCISPLATRPILYTDTLGGNQTMRDDLWAVTTAELNELATRCRAEGGHGAPEAAAQVASKTAETRMDAGSNGGAGSADRAQQGEPVACDFCPDGQLLHARVCNKCDAVIATSDDVRRNLAKAAASAEQEMVVRVAPAPAGQHDADELVALGAKMAAWLFGLSKSGLPYESWAEKCAEYSAAWDSALATSRAQRTTIDKLNSAVSGTPTSEAVETDAARYRWIEENARTEGGGHGFTITAFVPFDEEDMGCGIDKAIAAAPHPPEAKAGKGA